jgi:hypothetical protein
LASLLAQCRSDFLGELPDSLKSLGRSILQEEWLGALKQVIESLILNNFASQG